MRLLPVFLCLVGVSLASETNFLEFAKKFNKKYRSTEEYNKRRETFLRNYNDMLTHNQLYEEGKVSWWKKITEWSDLTPEEFAEHMNLGMPAIDRDVMTNTIDEVMEGRIAAGNAPEEWSWVEQGGVSSIKNQKSCGSCAAFATIATFDTCMWLATGTMEDDLSEQHLMDCANGHTFYDSEGAWGAFGCDGAWPQSYMDWIVQNNDGRVEKENCAPYHAQDRTCADDDSCNYSGAKITGFYNKWHTTEAEMKELVFVAPVATTVYASYFGDYGGGIFDDSRCCDAVSDPDCIWILNHEVSVVGYGSQAGNDYWLVKNSWGTGFGENGYIKIKRGTGHCGIGMQHIIQPYCS